MIKSFFVGLFIVAGINMILDAPLTEEDKSNPEKDGNKTLGIVLIVIGIVILLS